MRTLNEAAYGQITGGMQPGGDHHCTGDRLVEAGKTAMKSGKTLVGAVMILTGTIIHRANGG